jgi:AcrR family transcriptional regulator
MTEKQEGILKAALKLFAESGYNAVSTSKVARMAGVSEGLVFRHFKSKEGLLHAVMEMGKKRIIALFTKIADNNEPKAVLRGIIEIPFNIGQEEYSFWRLLYMVKWQTNDYIDSLFEPIHEMLVKAFKELDYSDPQSEAEAIKMLIDGIATNLLLRKQENPQGLLKSIFEKYDL